MCSQMANSSRYMYTDGSTYMNMNRDGKHLHKTLASDSIFVDSKIKHAMYKKMHLKPHIT